MIGAPLSSAASLFTAQSLRPLGAPAGATPASWLEGLESLGRGAPASLKADVAPDQRGLSVQQHAERVLAALIG
jgi:hypothetical protein